MAIGASARCANLEWTDCEPEVINGELVRAPLISGPPRARRSGPSKPSVIWALLRQARTAATSGFGVFSAPPKLPFLSRQFASGTSSYQQPKGAPPNHDANCKRPRSCGPLFSRQTATQLSPELPGSMPLDGRKSKRLCSVYSCR
jgi:hypothetical protein